MTTTPATQMPLNELPELSSEYALVSQNIAQYQRDGHILLRGVASAEEIAAYRPAINGAAERFNTQTRAIEERDTYGKAFLQIMNLWTRDEAVKRFTLAHRFAKIAADLMGVGGVRIYHDQALFKEPGGGPTPWHQDQYYWPLDTDNTITMWMPLVNIPEEVGSMTFGSGSQELGYLGEFEISDESEAMFNNIIAENGLRLTNYGALSAGDATWHSGWTLHGAPGNPTSLMREVMTIIYLADDTRISEPDNPHRADDLKSWMPGLKPGDMAASPINPLVYRR
jgi:ectoine hydroxylase-related dioxygenase (phytanoyl-CoA dioxygenase family)